ncbi:MAG: gliding motility-associated C-terminal domain-containing protein [Flavobacteriaceae bacterium]|nr:gliding motility-associated C-terminal domain-containing protein [Flavobacteriaceae bacterium]
MKKATQFPKKNKNTIRLLLLLVGFFSVNIVFTQTITSGQLDTTGDPITLNSVDLPDDGVFVIIDDATNAGTDANGAGYRTGTPGATSDRNYTITFQDSGGNPVLMNSVQIDIGFINNDVLNPIDGGLEGLNNWSVNNGTINLNHTNVGGEGPLDANFNELSTVATNPNSGNWTGITVPAGTVFAPNENSFDAASNSTLTITSTADFSSITFTFDYLAGNNPFGIILSELRYTVAPINLPTDTDGDQVPDNVDLDDDNDGILDTVECPPVQTNVWTIINPNGLHAETALGNGITVMWDIVTGNPGFSITNGQFNPAGNNIASQLFWNNAGVAGANSLQYAYQFGETLTISFVETANPANPVIVENPIMYVDRIGGFSGSTPNAATVTLLGGLTWTELSGTLDFTTTPTTAVDQSALNASGTNPSESNWNIVGGTASGTLQINGSVSQFSMQMVQTGPVGIGDGIEMIFDVQNLNAPSCDEDGDNIPNHLDLDSDNDGIYDVIEAGGTDTNTDGLADDDDDNANNTASNGIPTSAGSGVTPIETTTGTSDYLNTDSDNDGCSDANEAYVNANADGGDDQVFGLGTPTVDANGLITGPIAATYTTGAVPAVTDNTDQIGCIIDDGDGVDATIEDAGPNTGDGNNDGTLDSLQSNVASIPDAIGSGYVTLEITGATCNQITNINTILETDVASLDPNFDYPIGLIDFTLSCGNVGESATIVIYWHGLPAIDLFRKYGSTAPGANDATYDAFTATMGTTIIDGITVPTTTYSLTDGAAGDESATGAEIVDPVGPAISEDVDGDNVPNADDICPGSDDNADADGDGVPDGCDLDIDNDGIPNYIDNPCEAAFTFNQTSEGWFTNNNNNGIPISNPANHSNDPATNFGNCPINIYGVSNASIAGLSPTNTNYIVDTDNGPGIMWLRSPNFGGLNLSNTLGGTFQFDSYNYRAGFTGNPNWINISTPITMQFEGTDGTIVQATASINYPNWENGIWNTFTVVLDNANWTVIAGSGNLTSVLASVQNIKLRMEFIGGGDTGNCADIEYYALDNIIFKGSGVCDEDTDNDGIPDQLDLDSDNDGIYDIVEAGLGSFDTNNDGLINTLDTGFIDANGDGLDDRIVLLAALDTDDDGIADFRDTDSDNDGCSDADEAYNDLNTDTDNNGHFGSGTPPPTNSDGTVTAASYTPSNITATTTIGLDTDSDGISDFCDDDDDNDGNPDISDPNPLVPTTTNDTGTTDVNTPVTIDIITNDDYLANNDPNSTNPITISDTGTGTAAGTITFDPVTGEVTYTPLPSEAGETITIIYEVCNDIAPLGLPSGSEDICAQATITLTINTVILAENDDLSGSPVDGLSGGIAGNVFADNGNGTDTINGVDVTDPDVNGPTITADGGLTGITINTNGDVNVPSGSTPGTYLITYEICVTSEPATCNTATVEVVVSDGDTDGDGVPDSLDPDPLNPCLPVQTAGYTGYDATNTIWQAADCDGDGVTNGDEDPNTDPYDACDYNPADQQIADVTITWLVLDCDGDGIPNGTDTDPQDPCTPVQTAGYTGYDATNITWQAADCDGDGVTNGDEDSNTDPYDACDYNPADQIYADTTVIWRAMDCDGDGVINSDEIENDNTNPLNNCEFEPTSVTVLPDTNWEATDCDGDGVNNGFEVGDPFNPIDSDGDNTPDYFDTDDDGDTIDTEFENPDPNGDGNPDDAQDTDGDNTPDYLDIDDDGDTVDSEFENPDPNGDGNPDDAQDTDGDNTPDYLDIDDDGDTVDSEFENPDPNGDGNPDDAQDTDGDNTPDYLDTDDDGDGIPTDVEGADPNGDGNPDDAVDTDGDNTPDYLDNDSDNDGIPDNVEAGEDPLNPIDTDGDGIPDFRDIDSDNDGIPDAEEAGNDPTNPTDSDGDNIPDYNDLDSDNDGTPDVTEAGGDDPDNDGIIGTGPIVDTDGDGLSDIVDPDDAGVPLENPDTDNDGVNDIYDLDSDNDGIPDVTESGGDDPDGDGIIGTGPITDTDGDGLSDTVDLDDGGTPLANPDTDGDNIPDNLDLDSDNDGIVDVIEAGGLDPDNDGIIGTGPIVDTDGDGLSDMADPTTGGTPLENPDNDGDNLPDTLDIDADNDGVPDNVEAQPTTSYISPSGNDANQNGIDDAYEGTGFINPEDTDEDDTPDYLDQDSDNDGIDDVLEAGQILPGNTLGDLGTDTDGDGLDDIFDDSDDTGGQPDVNDNLEGGAVDTDNEDLPGTPEVDFREALDTDGDNIPDVIDIDDDNDGIADIDENPNGIDPSADADNDGVPNYLDDEPNNPLVGDQDGEIEAGFDFDNDGIPNHFDIDSDNDGIFDVVETGNGNLDTDNDGDVDINDAVFTDTNADGQADNTAGTTPVNTDDNPGDGPDFLDIDADDDGIPDNVEAQPTTSYISPSGTDANQNGIDDAYEGTNAIDPEDTDGDNTPDYLDQDSDNDGVNDLTEGGQGTFEGTDSDGDGLDDGFDEVNTLEGDPFDVNDEINDPTDGTDIQNSDGTDEPDYRDTDSDNDGIPDAIEGQTDTDGDNLPDYLDIDDDNDGILTANESADDTDGDNLPDYLDQDSDADGIPDNVEAQPTDGYIAPTGLDDDGDGLDNAYDNPENEGIHPEDTDDDGEADYIDLDSDDDGVEDAIEAWDTNSDGEPEIEPSGSDINNNGIDDAFEDGVTTETNYADPNGILDTGAEGTNNTDTQDEPDFRDTDDDNDGIPTGNNNPDTEDSIAADCDSDGIPNYLDPNPCNLIPQGFTPNGDNINDTLVIPGVSNAPNFEIEIYNRWGNLVYEYSNNGRPVPEWWNGFSNGKWTLNENSELVPVGTYFYVITFNDNQRDPIQGWIYVNY